MAISGTWDQVALDHSLDHQALVDVLALVHFQAYRVNAEVLLERVEALEAALMR